MKLNKIIEQNNQNADFTQNYTKSGQLKKKLVALGGGLTIAGLVVMVTTFVLIAVFGSDLQKINSHTAILVTSFVLLALFCVAFGFGLHILRLAQTVKTEGMKSEE